MPLTPIDIQQKTFGPELRGYNMDEVDDFLDEVVATLKDYDQRIRDAQDRIRALEAEVSTRGEDETAISRALVAAQKQADMVLEEAHKDAERIRSDAFEEADQLRTERDAERMSLTQELARMRATVADLKRRVVELAASAEEDLDSMDAAIADASDSITDPIPTEPAISDTPLEERDDEEALPGQHLDPWADEPIASGDTPVEESEQAGTWDEGRVDHPEWETPGSEWEAEDDDFTPEEESDSEESDVGDLADELAEEASPDADDSTSPAPGRRPWERGSV